MAARREGGCTSDQGKVMMITHNEFERELICLFGKDLWGQIFFSVSGEHGSFSDFLWTGNIVRTGPQLLDSCSSLLLSPDRFAELVEAVAGLAESHDVVGGEVSIMKNVVVKYFVR